MTYYIPLFVFSEYYFELGTEGMIQWEKEEEQRLLDVYDF